MGVVRQLQGVARHRCSLCQYMSQSGGWCGALAAARPAAGMLCWCAGMTGSVLRGLALLGSGAGTGSLPCVSQRSHVMSAF